MPPKDAGGKLTAAEIADLEAWVQSGAFDPRLEKSAATIRKTWEETFTERQKWWSLQPITNPRCRKLMISRGAARRLIDFSAIEWGQRKLRLSDWRRRKH